MALEIATYISGLNTSNPVGSDPLAQADDHIRLIKSTLKNTFPNINGEVDLTDETLNGLPNRVEALEEGGIGAIGGGTVTFPEALPEAGEYVGELVFVDDTLYSWDGSEWLVVSDMAATGDAPDAIGIVDELPEDETVEDGDIVLLREDNKLYKRVNGAWVELELTVTAAEEVADGSITTAKFAQGITPLEVVETLPTTNNFEGRLVYRTTDDKIYRYTGTAWTAGTATSDLTGTIGADLIEANSITAGKIAAGAVSADQIAANAVSADKIAAGAITTEKLAAVSITSDKLATNAITSDKITAGAITAAKISAGAIGTTQLAASAITSDKISSGAITATTIASGAITSAKISAGAVTATAIAAGAVTATKLSVTNLSSITAALGDVTSGTIKIGTGGAVGTGLTAPPGYSLPASPGTAGSGARLYVNASGYTFVDTLQVYGNLYSITNTARASVSSPVSYAYNDSSNSNAQAFKGYTNGVYAFYSDKGAYGPFTGAHDVLIPKNAQVTPGDIIVESQVIAKIGVSDVICAGAVSAQANKPAIGIASNWGDLSSSQKPAALQGKTEAEYAALQDTYKMVFVNGVGEGQVSVCGEGGNIEAGDLIVTSPVPGKGMKQADDLVRSYTVARAREAAVFSSPSEVKLIACVYLCG